MQSAAEKARVGAAAEAAVEAALTAAGWEVINLNELAKNFRFADLLAKQGPTRLFVQVKGTTTREGKFGALPERAQGLDSLAEHLDAIALYALVHLMPQGPVIRFGHAQQAASLAAERIAAYHGKLRYHLFITDFIFEAVDLAELLK
jgi:Holliday junction resolvase